MVIQITDSNFNDIVIKENKLVMVDFWAEWCGPCRQIAPIFEEASDDFKDHVLSCKINIDENPMSPSKYGVRGLPTILFFRGGQVIGSQIGATPKNKLYDKIQSFF